MIKRCYRCKELKSLTEFNKDNSRNDGHRHDCRKCDNTASQKYQRNVIGRLSMSENKKCAAYLGIAVAERLIIHIFNDVKVMSYGNPGYDFICANDKKIDVKSGCLLLNHGKLSRWNFNIEKNQIADYFLLLAFNSRNELEPQHMWLIPGNILNHLTGATISPSTIDKWDQYRQPINETVECCNEIKSQS